MEITRLGFGFIEIEIGIEIEIEIGIEIGIEIAMEIEIKIVIVIEIELPRSIWGASWFSTKAPAANRLRIAAIRSNSILRCRPLVYPCLIDRQAMGIQLFMSGPISFRFR